MLAGDAVLWRALERGHALCPDCSPPSRSLNEIRDELYRLRMPLPGARWMKPESYHITLRFAGDIGNVAAREFAANLSRIEPDGFELRFLASGFWRR